MNESDYTDLLEAVTTAMRHQDVQDLVFVGSPSIVPPLAANDNGREWPLLPFPEGWHASC